MPTAKAEKVDPLIKDYIPRIESGEIKPPQYEIKDENGDGIDDDLGIRRDSPKPKEWIESLKSQKFGGESNTVLVNKNQKEIKIKKVDKNGKPIEGVTFLYYYNKKDAIEGKIYTADEIVSDKNGIIKFNILPPAYFFYAREIDAPKKYIISNEIISFYRDNRVRFIGETEVKDLKVNEAKNGQNLNEYLQELISNDELT